MPEQPRPSSCSLALALLLIRSTDFHAPTLQKENVSGQWYCHLWSEVESGELGQERGQTGERAVAAYIPKMGQSTLTPI